MRYCLVVELLQKSISRLWILIAKLQIGFRIGRVESKSSVADGPSRLDKEWMAKLQKEVDEIKAERSLASARVMFSV